MYYDLCNSKTFDSVRDALELTYWISKDLLWFVFDMYGRKEETLEKICDYYWIEIEDLLKDAWIDEEDEEEDD